MSAVNFWDDIESSLTFGLSVEGRLEGMPDWYKENLLTRIRRDMMQYLSEHKDQDFLIRYSEEQRGGNSALFFRVTPIGGSLC